MTGHRYWRLYDLTAVNDYALSFAEIQFRTTAGVALLFSGGTASASASGSSNAPSLATDGDINTFWSSTSEAPAGQWWQYDYGTGNTMAIVEVVLTARNDGAADQGNGDFYIQYSDDASNWYLAATFATTFTTAGQSLTYTFPAPRTTFISAFDPAAAGPDITLSNTNLTATGNGSGSNWQTVLASVQPITTGKKYFELTANVSTSGLMVGVASPFSNISVLPNPYLGSDVYSCGMQNDFNNIWYNGSSTGSNASGDGSNYAAGVTVGIAYDADVVVTAEILDSATSGPDMTLSNNNLTVLTTGSDNSIALSTVPVSTGLVYFEFQRNTLITTSGHIGLAGSGYNLSSFWVDTFILKGNGDIRVNDSYQAPSLLTPDQIATTDAVCFAVDMNHQRAWIKVGIANAWQGASGSDPTTSSTGFDIGPMIGTGVAAALLTYGTGIGGTFNFGSTPFLGVIPTGYQSFTANAIPDAKTIWFTIDGTTWTNGGNPATASGGFHLASTPAGSLMLPALSVITTTTDEATINLAGPFAYTIPSGFSIWNAGPSIDGSATATSNNTVVLTTEKPNDVIIAFVAVNFASGETALTSVSGGGLTWNFRGRSVDTQDGSQYFIEEWWAPAALPLSAVTITANLPGDDAPTAVNGMVVFAVNGAFNYESPFDTGGAPFTGLSSVPTFSTTAPASVAFVGGRASASPPAGSTAPWTTLLAANYTTAGYAIFTSAQTNTAAAFGSSNDYSRGWIVDAIVTTPIPTVSVPPPTIYQGMPVSDYPVGAVALATGGSGVPATTNAAYHSTTTEAEIANLYAETLAYNASPPARVATLLGEVIGTNPTVDVVVSQLYYEIIANTHPVTISLSIFT